MNKLNIWGKGQLLALSGLDGQTDYFDGLVLRTRNNAAIDLKFPVAKGQIIFPEDAITQNVFLASDCLKLNGGITAVLPDTHHILIEGPAKTVDLPDDYQALATDNRLLVGLRKHFTPELINADIQAIFNQYAAYYDTLPTFGLTDEHTKAALYKAYSQLKGMIYSPYENFPYYWSTPDRWPHRRMWLWDSVFHAIGIRHFNLPLAKDILRAVLASQLPDGLIPHMMSPDVHSRFTQPPVLALGIRMLCEIEPDRELLAWALPKLAAHLEWIMANRDTDGAGLVEWNIEGEPTCRSGESGMDNSPRFDSATQLDATDFNAFLSLECECLADFARALGQNDTAAYWQAHHDRLNELMRQRLWCQEERIFMDRDVTTDKLTGIAASSGFLPLICGAATPEQAALMRDNLNDPETFATPNRVPSISRKCTAQYQKDMWRGPVWLNVNWLIAYGLKRYGFLEDAQKLRRDSARLEEKFYLKYGTFFEFFDDRDEVDPPCLNRKGKLVEDSYNQVFFDYGWSASLFVDFIQP